MTVTVGLRLRRSRVCIFDQSPGSWGWWWHAEFVAMSDHAENLIPTSCPLYIFMLHLCPFCMSILHVHFNVACPSCMSMLHVYASRPCCMSMLHVHASCQCFMSMPHVHAAFLCCISMQHVHASCSDNDQMKIFNKNKKFITPWKIGGGGGGSD